MDDAQRAQDNPELVEIVLRVATGDREAYSRLYDVMAPRVYGLVLKIVGSSARSEADDILQDVMFELWRNAAKYNPEHGSVSTWVLLIARSRTIDHLRKRTSASNAIDAVSRRGAATEVARGLPAIGVRAELDRSLGVLPEDQRTAFTMAFARGMTREQIAAALDLPVGTVKTRVRSAVQRLAAFTLETQGGTP